MNPYSGKLIFMGYNPLDWVLSFLKEGGASDGDLLIARQRGQELINQYGSNSTELERYVLDNLKAEYGITTPELDNDQEKTRAGAIYRIQNIENSQKRGTGLMGWLRRGRNKEGD